MKALVGKTIAAVDLAEDGGALRFTFDDGGEQVYLADGDCCSHTWVESIDDVGALIGGTVAETEELDLGGRDTNENEDGEYVQLYGYKITTDKGRATVDFRNASNGYYGGDLVLEGPDTYFYGGVHGQNVSERAWRRLGG